MRRTAPSHDGKFRAGGIEVDSNGRRVTAGGAVVRVRPTEFRLIETLIRHPERAFDRAQLLDKVWGRNVYVEERTVDVHVLRLRKALAPFGMDKLIQTVRGVGYRFSTNLEAA